MLKADSLKDESTMWYVITSDANAKPNSKKPFKLVSNETIFITWSWESLVWEHLYEFSDIMNTALIAILAARETTVIPNMCQGKPLLVFVFVGGGISILTEDLAAWK